MNFDFTEAEQAFAEEVRRFIRANPPDTFPIDGMDAGYGSGANSRAFMRALGAQGWLSMCWPKAFGGREQPMFMKLVLMEELALAGAPFGPLAGVWQTADAIIEIGTERLRHEVLPAIARGEATFWQGYSEPDAGSDLLALKTEARRDGDHWVIHGHKIWSSHAGIATHGLVFARTSREARRSRGFSMFVVTNDTPGMDIRPIRSMTGEVYHHEVFLDDVRVPADLMLGSPGEGFQALLNGLDADRFWGRFYKAPALTRVLRQLVDYANTTVVGGAPLARDPFVRRRLAAIAADIAALRLVFYRAGCLIRDGQGLRRRDGPEAGATRHGPARSLGAAARGLALGEAGRPRLAPLSDDPRSHDRGGNCRDPAHHRRGARARPHGGAEDGGPGGGALRWTFACHRPSRS